MTTGHHSDDQVGRNATKRNLANHCQHRQSDTSSNSPTEDESCRSGNRQSREGLLPDVLAQIRLPRPAIR
jgi:hypothetical protein